MSKLYKKVVFDAIHGYISLTKGEQALIQTPYYQRLRWIKQLGFTFYIFPGGTHTRFPHTLGVMHMMDRILRSIGKAVPEDMLFDPNNKEPATMFHRKMRFAALLHDIGTFPFSHTIELAYINHWKKQQASGVKSRFPGHEALGAHIIQNTDFAGGITQILKEEGIDPTELSLIIAGKSHHLLANQLMHSDIDADRMDYLLRDAHHTGVNYGVYDADYLIHNLKTFELGGQEGLGINDHARNIAEYFLICRYSWYSQIIDDGTGYKFDLIAAKIYEYFLENGLAHSFDHIYKNIALDPNAYFTFNDSYFQGLLHQFLANPSAHPVIRELCEMLAYRKAPKQIKIAPVVPTLIESSEHRSEVASQISGLIKWLENELNDLGPEAWLIHDIPSKDIQFTKNMDMIRKEAKGTNVVLLRDPVKVIKANGDVKLLVEEDNSLLNILSHYRNFIPRIYVSAKTYEKLEKRGSLKAFEAFCKTQLRIAA